VFWAGRWDRQKRIGLLLDIARRMPDLDFRMWGERVMGQDVGTPPANVLVQGLYGHISEIPLAEADVWLYTSGWDGVPSQLLEVAMTGVPMVGTLVGGTGEVMLDGAWPVPLEAGADAYEAAIRAVLADPQQARRRALALRDRLLRERTLEAYAETAAATLLTDRGADR
jgi:glycosyltransferase involved in cell wall biosynthesis